MSRSLVSLLGLGRETLLGLATGVLSGPAAGTPLAGKVVAVLPLGPAALPAAAWISAATRLGAGVVRLDDLLPAPDDPFELCREAARWADVLVVSHPSRGFARALAASDALTAKGVAVVNAGEGSGEDPTAGLSLLAAALGARDAVRSQAAVDGEEDGLRVAVCGDLRGSRAARGFLGALAAVEATVLLVPARGNELPSAELDRLARRTGRSPLHFEARSMRSLLDMVDTVLLAPDPAPQLPLFREIGVPPGEAARRARRAVEDMDILFVAAGADAPDRLVTTPFRRRGRAVPTGIEHRTSPRAVEAVLAHCASDADPHADPHVDGGGEAPELRGGLWRYREPRGVSCRGERCVAARHPVEAPPDFLLVGPALATPGPHTLECLYCGARTDVGFVGSHEARRFHPTGTPDARKILDENTVLFRSRGEALAAGFAPSRRIQDVLPARQEETP